MHIHLLILPDVSRCKCLPTGVHSSWLIYAGLDWCCIPLENIGCQMWTCQVKCIQALVNTSCLWPTSLAWYTQAYADGACRWPTSISPSWCTHAMSYLCTPLMMFHSIDDATCKCTTSLVMHTNHIICVKTLLMLVVCLCFLDKLSRPWPMLPYKYTHNTGNSCIP